MRNYKPSKKLLNTSMITWGKNSPVIMGAVRVPILETDSVRAFEESLVRRIGIIKVIDTRLEVITTENASAFCEQTITRRIKNNAHAYLTQQTLLI